MRKVKAFLWIPNTFLFFVVVAFLYVHLSYVFRPISQNRANIVGYYSEEPDTIDVVMIGGSSTYVFWVPYEAWNAEGIVSYNFSTDSVSPALIKGMIEEARKTQSPKLYVIDLRALEVEEEHHGFYTDAYLRNVTDSMKYSWNRNDTIYYAYGIEQPQLKYKLSTYFDLSKYHVNWQTIDTQNLRYWNNDVKEPLKGFMLVRFSYHQAFERNDYDNVQEEFPLSEKTDQILIDLLEYCKANNIPALFTLNPIYRDSTTVKARYNYVQRRVEEYGYSFIDTNDYYDEMGIDFSKDFYNRDHVNLFGAEKYTRFLAHIIKTKYNLPNHKGEEKYADWEDAATAWKTTAKEFKAEIEDAILKENDQK